jgi:hypothetical protein
MLRSGWLLRLVLHLLILGVACGATFITWLLTWPISAAFGWPELNPVLGVMGYYIGLWYLLVALAE